MTTNDQLVAKALEKANLEVKELPDSPEARARHVAALQSAMRQAAAGPVRRARWPLAVAAGVATLLGGGLGLQARPPGVAQVVASSGALEVGHRLAEAQELDTGAAEVTLSVRGGVLLALSPQTTVQVKDDGARVSVRRGQVAAEVASRESPFYLEAGDTQVASRGARFRATPGAGCDGRAQVVVLEGAVTIDGAAGVEAGGEWPRCAPAAAPPAPREPGPVREKVKPPGPAPKRAALSPPAALPETAQERELLARHNELYLQALTLQRAGDVGGAVKKLDAMLSTPRSPLAETALAQKMRWLTPTDRAAAREVAREYLDRFPKGYGRADAETLVLELEPR